MKRRSASVQVGIWRRSSMSKPSAVRMRAAAASTFSVSATESDERQRVFALGSREIAVPLLALLADVDGIEQIGARPFDVPVADGAEVRNRHLLDRRLRQEQEPDRRVRGLGELLQLLQRRACVTALPVGKLREALRQRREVEPGTLARPAQQLRLDLYPHAYCLRSGSFWLAASSV